MTFSQELLSIIVCPKCRSALIYDEAREGLICNTCQLLYPIQNGIPVMLEDEAFPIDQGGEMAKLEKRRIAVFEIIEGKNKGEVIKLPPATCKAIGRSLDDLNKTQVFSMDFTMSLDDFTKKLIMNYIGKKFPQEKPVAKAQAVNVENIGSFKRLPDLILDDPAISRLHAMIFYDENGAGILDLVSKNGTYVNSEEIESQNLQEGDEVEVGGTKMVLSYR